MRNSYFTALSLKKFVSCASQLHYFVCTDEYRAHEQTAEPLNSKKDKSLFGPPRQKVISKIRCLHMEYNDFNQYLPRGFQS